MSHAHDNARRQARETSRSTFTGFEDFTAAFNEARRQCAAIYGDRWDLHPQAYIWAQLPAAWARARVAGRVVPQRLPALFDPPLIDAARDSLPAREPLPAELVGERWSTAPRDQKLPVARFWPNGELPVGPEYETSSSATLKPKARFPSLAREAQRDQRLHAVSAEQWQAMFPETMPAPAPAKLRRPSGIGLPSGRERAKGDFYVDPRWLDDALLDVETFDGSILDPFCGGGSIVGACLQRGLAATGSDLHDRGFGERRDAFTIAEPFDNLIANPPFALIEQVIRHFLPLVRRKLVLLARLNVLEGQERRVLFESSPPARVWVSSRRASMPPGTLNHPRDQFGAIIPLPATGGSTAYCWTVWDRDHVGRPVLGWIPQQVSAPAQRASVWRARLLHPEPAATATQILLPEVRERHGVAIAKRVLTLANERGLVDAQDSSGARWTGTGFVLLRDVDIFARVSAPKGQAVAPAAPAPGHIDRITAPRANVSLVPVTVWQRVVPAVGERPALINGTLPDGQQITLQTAVHEALVWAAGPGGELVVDSNGRVFARDAAKRIVGVGAVIRGCG